MKKLVSKLVSHQVSLFDGIVNIGMSYRSPGGVTMFKGSKKHDMEHFGISLFLITFHFNWSQFGLQYIEITSGLTSLYEFQNDHKIKIDLEDKDIEACKQVKENGNWNYKAKTLISW